LFLPGKVGNSQCPAGTMTMKRLILIAMALVAALAAPAARAEEPLNLLLTGGNEDNWIRIGLSPDGRDYEIASIVPLEIGSDVCEHPEGNPNKLLCEATAIASFEVNAGGGNDAVILFPTIPVPATLRGGPGEDRLFGAAEGDKLLGGSGNDELIGRGGNDWIYGGSGDDKLIGGSGDDHLSGGPGMDLLVGQSGHNTLRQ
jgi:Ca2+-binding RTX toxin-like protein